MGADGIKITAITIMTNKHFRSFTHTRMQRYAHMLADIERDTPTHIHIDDHHTDT